MMDLKTFLLERIEADEVAARKLAETDHRPVLSLATTVNHPERILAECAAKREIMERHSSCDDVSYGDASTCPEMRNLAAIYADHPDYQPEWAQEASH